METQAFKMTSLAKENFPQRNISNTVKVRVPDVDRRKCDLKTIWGVVIEVDLTKDLYKIRTKDGILNLLCTRNQFRTYACAEGIVNIPDVTSIKVSLRECAGKASLFGVKG